VKSLVLALAVGLAALAAPGPAAAQDPVSLQVNADAVKLNLENLNGKRVRLRLVSGQDLEGVVKNVGSAAVHLERLAGLDFFDAVVRLDQIAAVIVRARGQ